MEICGIDEAGRGALAGPLVVAGCVLNNQILGLKDSKKLTAKSREKLFKDITANSKFLVIYFSNFYVDNLGLSECLKRSLICLRQYFNKYELIFDGNTSYQTSIKTMVKADSKIEQVSAASILAKVSRDRLMILYDKLYPNYGYAKHKGYGTKEHIDAISKYGQNELTRTSFKLKHNENCLF